MFYENQKQAAIEITRKFDEVNEVLLMAQMQSGKTGTFIYAALEMLRAKTVKRVVIFSGVSSVELFEQLNVNVIELCAVYSAIHSVPSFRDRFILLRASDLKRHTLKKKTLLIYDESHFAQRNSNRVASFIEANGFRLDGSDESLAAIREKKLRILTISATPFAECSQMSRRDSKAIVYAKPGKGYRGVQHFVDTDSLRSSRVIMDEELGTTFFEGVLSEEYERLKGQRYYGIVRLSPRYDTDVETIESLCEAHGFEVIRHFGDHHMKSGWKKLTKRPKQPTIVLIKGHARVGQNVPKKNVGFVYESVNGFHRSSDSTFQSLIGRMCGYGPFFKHGTRVYTSIYGTKKGERSERMGSLIDKYVSQVKTESMHSSEVSRKQNTIYHEIDEIEEMMKKVSIDEKGSGGGETGKAGKTGELSEPSAPIVPS
jgi:hypothetical protein